MLVEAGASVNAKGTNDCTPLHYAVCQRNKKDMALYLLEHGANINAKASGGSTPLGYMIMHSPAYTDGVYNQDRFDLAMLLIEQGASVSDACLEGHLMYWAANTNDNHLLEYLWLQGEIDINQKALKSKQTALMYAVMRNSKQACQFLLNYGAEKSITDAHGKTAYDIAMEMGYTEIAEMVKP